MGGTSQNQVLSSALPTTSQEPELNQAVRLHWPGFLEAAPLLPMLLAQPPLPALGRTPGPRTVLGGLRTAGCLLPEVLCLTQPHPNCRLLPLPLLCQSSAQKRALPQCLPPEFSPELKTLSCTQIPEGSGTQLMLSLGLSLQMLTSLT